MAIHLDKRKLRVKKLNQMSISGELIQANTTKPSQWLDVNALLFDRSELPKVREYTDSKILHLANCHLTWVKQLPEYLMFPFCCV